MSGYMSPCKRNQVEEAISSLLGEHKPSAELRTRLKRLLDTDRGFGRKPHSNDPVVANYAFYSSEAPGKGVEVEFPEYEAFALLTSLRLLQHGWPQGFAVNMLRQVRAELEREHARILKQDPDKLFDEKAIREKAKPGDLYIDNTDPVFLVIVSGEDSNADDNLTGSICRGIDKVFEFIRRKAARSWTFHELATSAPQLKYRLSKVQPRKR